jgi:hypothetical protein
MAKKNRKFKQGKGLHYKETLYHQELLLQNLQFQVALLIRRLTTSGKSLNTCKSSRKKQKRKSK